MELRIPHGGPRHSGEHAGRYVLRRRRTLPRVAARRRIFRELEKNGHPGRSHRVHGRRRSREQEKLVGTGGPDRTVRTRHGNVLLGRKGRTDRQPENARRRVDGNLERRVHPIQQTTGRHVRRNGKEERRHGHGPRARGRGAARSKQRLRHRPHEADRRQGDHRPLDAGTRTPRAHRHRPHQGRDVHDRRRRAPLERRPGLRAPPPHPTRDPLIAAAGDPRPKRLRLDRRRSHRAVRPRAHAHQNAGTRDRERDRDGGGAIQQDIAGRPQTVHENS